MHVVFFGKEEKKTKCVSRAEQIPVLQSVPCADTGPLQESSLRRRPKVLQIGCRPSKIDIQLRGDAGLQIRCV